MFGFIFCKGYALEMQRKIERMTHELRQKEEEMERLKQTIENLEDSKRTLAINSNKCLNDMREYLLIYQNAVFRTKSNS